MIRRRPSRRDAPNHAEPDPRWLMIGKFTGHAGCMEVAVRFNPFLCPLCALFAKIEARIMGRVILLMAFALIVVGLVKQQSTPRNDGKPVPASTTASAAETNGPRVMSIGSDGNGHFQTRGRVDGYPVDF